MTLENKEIMKKLKRLRAGIMGYSWQNGAPRQPNLMWRRGK